MRILGVDPGYDRLGIAVIEKSNGKEELVYSECFETDSGLPFSERLSLVGTTLERIVAKHSPHHVALESVYFNTNKKTAMDVAAVRGVVLYIGERRKLEVFEYTPPQIKLAVAGAGRGSKEDVISMLHHLVDIKKEILLDDEYDAIAVALTHSAIHR
ncbi:crossover junction endodeoxyribonuclease RuvC [bacterium]|nr:crossover junction endodeoxyribonuclease RuvC [bacterium]|tara:strand:- start:32 stop:502 length:471 start_codon:yes stop_codon:yes gene_type:complete